MDETENQKPHTEKKMGQDGNSSDFLPAVERPVDPKKQAIVDQLKQSGDPIRALQETAGINEGLPADGESLNESRNTSGDERLGREAELPESLRDLATSSNRDIQDAYRRIRERDWSEDLRYASPGKTVEILLTGHWSREDTSALIVKSFDTELENIREYVSRYESKLAQDPSDHEAKLMLPFEKARLAAAQAESSRMQEDPEYANQWYEAAKDSVLSAKQGLKDAARRTDKTLTNLLGKHQGSEVSDPLENRSYVLTQTEYAEAMKSLNRHPDVAFDMGLKSFGFVTLPEGTDPRIALTKLQTQLKLKDPHDPSKGLMIEPNIGKAKRNQRHELIHIVSDRNQITTESSNEKGEHRLINRRGFRTYSMFPDGRLDADGTLGFTQNGSEVAYDEAAVVYLEEYLNSYGNTNAATDSLRRARSGVHDISRSYLDGALINASIVDRIGVAPLAEAYAKNDSGLFVHAVGSQLGTEEQENYGNQMRSLQGEMRNFAA